MDPARLMPQSALLIEGVRHQESGTIFRISEVNRPSFVDTSKPQDEAHQEVR